MTIPITLATVYKALDSLFPRDGKVICDSITNLIRIPEGHELEKVLNTLAIDMYGNLYVSEKFWNEYITDDSSLKSILLHELIHQVVNDTKFMNRFDKDDKEFSIKKMAANIAQDARINAYIVQFSNIKDADKVFKKIYSKEVLENMPLGGLLTPNGKTYIPTEELKSFHDYYYGVKEKGIYGFLDLYQKVLDYLRKNPPPESGEMLIFIGAHGELKDKNGNQLPQKVQEAIKEAIKDYIKNHNTPQDKKEKMNQHAGSSMGLQEVLLNEAMGIDQKLNLEYFKRLSFDSVMNNVRLTMLETTNERIKSIFLPSTVSRMDIFKLMFGYIPLTWDDHAIRYKKKPTKIPIYLDVSGSMWSELPAIIEMILNIRDDIEYVWGFSNEVHKHTMEDLRNKKIRSTGGTDFDCIISHAEKEGFRSLLVITDGYANCSQPMGQKHDSISDVVTVLCCQGRTDQNYFCGTYETTMQIEEITE